MNETKSSTALSTVSSTSTSSSTDAERRIGVYLAELQRNRHSSCPQELSEADKRTRAQIEHNMTVVAQFDHLHKLTRATEKLVLLETVLTLKSTSVAQLQEVLLHLLFQWLDFLFC